MSEKIVFFDIDGTLVDHNKEIPTTTVNAIKRLKQEGVFVAIATGRAPFMFEEIREKLQIDSYISFNGQYVVFEGEVVYENPHPFHHLLALADKSRDNGHSLVFMSIEEMKASNGGDDFVKTSLKTLNRDYPEIDPQFYRKKEIYQVLLFCKQEDEDTYSQAHNEFAFVRWHEFSCDVLPFGGSKAKGIEKLLEAAGFEQKDSYAFGDGLNDMEMLKHVGTSVAMGNAIPSLKKIADYVTADVDKEGLAKGLYQVGLLNVKKS